MVPGAVALAAAMTVAAAAMFQTQRTPNVDSAGNILSAVAALASNDVWAVGFSGNSTGFNQAKTLTEHFNGTSWSVMSSPNPNPNGCANPSFALTAVAPASHSDVWAVGYRNSDQTCTTLFQPIIFHWNGSAWSDTANPLLSPAGNNALNGVVSLASNNVYAVGYQSGPLEAVQTLVEHWDGVSWSVVPSPNANSTGNVLNGVSAVNPSDIWAVGDQVAPNVPVLTLTEHWNGSAWSVAPSPNPVTGSDLDQNVLNAVVSLAPNDVTAVGFTLDFNAQRVLTLIEHWNGTSWSVVPSPNPSTASGALNKLTSVAALSPSNIYAFGFFANSSTGGQTLSLALHYDGVSWNTISAPTPARAQQLFGAAALSSTRELWSVGGSAIHGIDFETGTLQLPKTLAIFTATP
ncbi:MAG: hypothetical protein C5B51_19140 [Terriglobia bacterium]|nr:MAG: hypothetical protein C5B51_19140 [Terriglobia bacterium]